MFRKRNLLCILVGILILLTNGIGAVFAQADDLSLKDTQNGFTGIFKSGNQTLTVDSTEMADKSILTKIKNSEGRLVAETVYKNALVTVTISDVVIKFRIDRESIAAGYFEQLSQTNQDKFEAYRGSEESRAVRKMIVEIIKQRASSKPATLKGILIISLVLGDGPGFRIEMAQKKETDVKCKPPHTLQIFASYVSPKISKSTNTPPSAKITECNASNCCGCCGVGCSGCYGC